MRTLTLLAVAATLIGASFSTPLAYGEGPPLSAISRSDTTTAQRSASRSERVVLSITDTDYDEVVHLPMVSRAAQAEKYPADNRAFELEVLRLVNLERVNAGLPELFEHAALTQAARRHAIDMAENNLINHTGSDGSRSTERMFEEGYTHVPWGETAGGAASPFDMVALWMSSTAHRGILLDSVSTNAGVGFALREGRPRYVLDTGH